MIRSVCSWIPSPKANISAVWDILGLRWSPEAFEHILRVTEVIPCTHRLEGKELAECKN